MTEVESVLKEPEYEQEAQEQPAQEVSVAPEKVEAEKAKEAPAEKAKEEPEDPATKYEKTKIALREERRRAKELEARAQEYESRLSKFETLQKELEEYRATKRREQEEQLYQTNPAEYLKNEQEKLKQQLEDAQKMQAETYEQAQRRVQLNKAVKSSIETFAEEHKDYQDAFNHVKEARFKEYEAFGVPKAQWHDTFESESENLALQCFNNGWDVAETVYNIAKARGFGVQAPKPAAEDTINRLEKGVNASKSLSGGNPEPSVLKAIDEMSDEEFHSWFNKEVRPRKHH